MDNHIKACVFDAYGTLFDVHSASRRLAPRVPNADKLSAIWRDKQLQYTWLRALMGRYVDFWEVTSEALDHALSACAIEDPELRNDLLAMYLSLDVYEEVPRTLSGLRESGRRTAILSNGSPMMLKAATESAGIHTHLDAVLSVDPLRTFKPDPRVYAFAEEQLGCEANEMAFMTSNAWDAHGAAVAGLHVFWINRFGQPNECLPGRLRAELRSLDALPAAL